MNYQVLFTDTAKEDLRSLAFSLAELSKDVNLARHFVLELQKSCQVLETFPESGALPRDRILKSAGYRFVVYKDYLLFYSVDREKHSVLITAVFNGKQDYMRRMRKYL